MNERVVVAQAANLQVSSLAPQHIIKVAKPQSDQSIALDLNHPGGARLDLSAVADEKMTFVQSGTKLVFLFDNQSTVIADPFFDSSGKPFADLDIALGGGHSVSGEQFAAVFPLTDDDTIPHAPGIAAPNESSNSAPNAPPSGANFHDASVDALPGSASPLALLGQEAQNAHNGAGLTDDASLGHNVQFQALAATPTVTIPAPGGPSTNVFESGLGARPGEPPGTHAGQSSFPVSTRPGTISFTSPGRGNED